MLLDLSEIINFEMVRLHSSALKLTEQKYLAFYWILYVCWILTEHRSVHVFWSKAPVFGSTLAVSSWRPESFSDESEAYSCFGSTGTSKYPWKWS